MRNSEIPPSRNFDFLNQLFKRYSLAVDNILLPENRAHLSLEVQLKELLEKLDIVSTMRSSGARTRRIRLLRREINSIRQKLAQQQNKTMSNGDLAPWDEGLEKILQGEQDEDGEKGKRFLQNFEESGSDCMEMDVL